MLRKHNSAAAFQGKHPKSHKWHTSKEEISEFTSIFIANESFWYSWFLDLLNEERFEILNIQAAYFVIWT